MSHLHRLALLPLLAGFSFAQAAYAAIIIEDRPLSAAPPVTAPVTAATSPAITTTADTSTTPADTTQTTTEASSTPAWDTYTSVQRLQDEVAQLRGQLEQQGHLIEKLQGDLRSRYLDLDQRLSNLQTQQKPSATESSSTNTDTAPSSVSIEDERKAYLTAYEMFQSGGADKAIPPMLAFVNRYPKSSFTPGAYYWLGEFYLNAGTPDPVNARKYFETVLEKYPDNSRAPAALYKVGSILDLQGKPQEAAEKMKGLLTTYPKSAEAALAQGYLKALESAAKPATPPAAKATVPAKTSTKAPTKKH